jgi:anti-sigma factor RsiW
MVDDKLKDRMHAALDGGSDDALRHRLEADIQADPDALALWALLQDAEEVLHDAPVLLPVMEPRRGFSGRFSARLSQQRRKRPGWLGVLALGVSALVPVLVVFGGVAAFLAPLATAVGQPTASFALQTSAEISIRVVSSLVMAGLTVLRASLAWPTLWVSLIAGLTATMAWLIWIRRILMAPARRPV